MITEEGGSLPEQEGTAVIHSFSGQKNLSLFTYSWWTIRAFFGVSEMFDMIIVSPLYVSASTTGTVVTFPPITVRHVVNLFELCKVGSHTRWGRSSARHAF